MDPTFAFIEERQDQNKTSFYFWRKCGTMRLFHEPTVHPSAWDGKPIAAEILNRVYANFLCSLTPAVGFGRDRGILQQEVDKRGYRILDARRTKSVEAAIDAGLEQYFPCIPGLSVKEKNGKRFWSMRGKGGILIPVRDIEGRIIALKVRNNASDAKYTYLSSKTVTWKDTNGRKRNGPGPGSPVHFPLFDGDKSIVRITEGELKADIATMRSNVWTISVPGVHSWQNGIEAVKKTGAKIVYVAYDSDYRTKKTVRESLVHLLRGLLALGGIEVILEQWPEDAGKGIDDVLVAGNSGSVERISSTQLIEFLRELSAQTSITSDPKDPRPKVLITPNEDDVNRQVIGYLDNDPRIFQRRGTLVHIIRDCTSRDGSTSEVHCISAPPDSPQIATLPEAKLRSLMTANIRFQAIKVSKDREEIVDAHPPDWCVRAVANYGEYPEIKSLEGVIETPIIRPDGTILDQPGYDPQSRLFYLSQTTFPKVPANPNHQDVRQAIATLLDIVADFPFASPIHQSAWLASMLTPMARVLFNGPAPLFLVEANVPGVGKTLLIKLNSIVHTGRVIATSSYTSRDEEMEKRITSIARAGYRLVLIDNINELFGGLGSMDAALTSTQWHGRILGTSKDVILPLDVTWFATGNNILIVGDTVRRVLPIRLEILDENPEDRGGFKYPKLLDYVLTNRPALVVACLTILRGFVNAGCPQSSLPSWGSYEGWTGIVRQAIVWTGLPDPRGASLEIRSHAQSDAIALSQFIDALEKANSRGAGLLAADMIRLANEDETLRSAILEICPTKDGMIPQARKLGNRLKSFNKRVVSGKYLEIGARSKKGCPIFVRTAEASAAGVSGDSGVSVRGPGWAEEISDNYPPESALGTLPRDTPESPDTPIDPPTMPIEPRLIESTTAPTSASSSIKIGRPSDILHVKEQNLRSDYFPSNSTPGDVTKYHEGSGVRPIPDQCTVKMVDIGFEGTSTAQALTD